MRPKYTPEDLQDQNNFELLTEVSHLKLKEFVVQQISKEKRIIPLYSIYQLIMVLLFIFLFARSVVLAIKGFHGTILFIGGAVIFSLSVLVVIHELLHALAYLVTGARKISFGAIPRKFIFYALADKQVIAPAPFRIVALAPFAIVKIICLIGIAIWFNQQLMYSYLTVMCLHSLFCSGDIAMLAFYSIHKGKEIYNYDDKTEGKTYFYLRKPEY
jgi:Protein of unknown function (DUF3267).